MKPFTHTKWLLQLLRLLLLTITSSVAWSPCLLLAAQEAKEAIKAKVSAEQQLQMMETQSPSCGSTSSTSGGSTTGASNSRCQLAIMEEITGHGKYCVPALNSRGLFEPEDNSTALDSISIACVILGKKKAASIDKDFLQLLIPNTSLLWNSQIAACGLKVANELFNDQALIAKSAEGLSDALIVNALHKKNAKLSLETSNILWGEALDYPLPNIIAFLYRNQVEFVFISALYYYFKSHPKMNKVENEKQAREIVTAIVKKIMLGEYNNISLDTEEKNDMKSSLWRILGDFTYFWDVEVIPKLLDKEMVSSPIIPPFLSKRIKAHIEKRFMEAEKIKKSYKYKTN